jgi:hypothetical protein
VNVADSKRIQAGQHFDEGQPALLAELRALLAGHSEIVRYLAAKTLTRISQEPMQAQQDPSSAKAAD